MIVESAQRAPQVETADWALCRFVDRTARWAQGRMWAWRTVVPARQAQAQMTAFVGWDSTVVCCTVD
jgi:hypothetical protein